MKTIVALGLLCGGSITVVAQWPEPPALDAPIAQTPYAVTERGPHHRVWQRTTWFPSPNGGEPLAVTNSYTELQTGLGRWSNGAWIDASDQIEITSEAAQAINALHQVVFQGNINVANAVDLTLPDGRHLTSNILGLSYLDKATRKSVLIAEIKDSQGKRLPPGNQAYYHDAFTDFAADVLYDNQLSGFEQFIILRERPPSPAEWGLDPETTVLQVITEFTGDVPVPEIRQALVDGDIDDRLDFGSMQMVKGAAFAIGNENNRIPVHKRWMRSEDGRQCLVEEVPLRLLKQELENLPPAPPPNPGHASLPSRSASAAGHLAGNTPLPAKRTAHSNTPVQIAAVAPREKGVVLDYSLLSSQTNLTLQCDTTYYVSGTVNVSGTTVAEGGAVIKITNSPSATLITSNLVCKTDIYRPLVITGKDDDTVGDQISGSTGSPSGYYGSIALNLSAAVSPSLKNVRFCYLSNALAGASITVQDAQFVQCKNAFASGSTQPALYNVLLYQLNSVLATTGANTLTAENVTAHYCTNFLAGTTGTINLTNCLFVCVTNWQCTQTRTNASVFLDSDTGVFQTVGGGSHYLADSSPYRNIGTTNISSVLLSDLRTKTTYPPVAYSNVSFSADSTFGPQAQRDMDVLDVGYEYDPLDYAFGGCTGSSNLTFNAGTAVGWFRTTSGWRHAGHGIHMADNQVLAFNGSVSAPDYWVRCNVVQEGCNGLWQGGYGPGGITGWAASTATAPELRARFLRCSMLAAEANHIRDDNGWLTVRLHDSELYGGGVGGYASSHYHTNCFYDRVSVWLLAGQTDTAYRLQNCTWHGGQLLINRSANPTSVVIRDCAFDTTNIVTSDAYSGNPALSDYNYNAFISGAPRTTPTGANDVLVTGSFNWQSSWLGNYYLPTNSTLIDAGSTWATNVGLYHFTTQPTQVKEGGTKVDIAYHYPAASKVTFIGTDESTQGNWKGVYGQDGYNVINDSVSYPAYATATPSGCLSYTWNSSPSDTRALQRASSGRIAACWYNASSFDVAIVQTDGKPHRIALYYLDWDSFTRAQTVDVRDSVTGTVLDSRTVTNFHGGTYLVWDILGNATLRFTRTGAANAVLSGIFFGPASFQAANADGDSAPDVMEDLNGNGNGSDDPTSWLTYDSANGLSAGAPLQIFTPLK